MTAVFTAFIGVLIGVGGLRTRIPRSRTRTRGRLARLSSGTASALAAAAALIVSAHWMGDEASAQTQLGSSQKPARAMIVLDGSNSMNGRIGAEPALKYTLVRDALMAALPNVTRGTELGLATFGARRASDCSDAVVEAPLATDFAKLEAELQAYRPRGYSPVVLAMRTAAKALPVMLPNTGKASMVLVMDDLASCRGEDPCEIASALKTENPALTIHVVGLGMKPRDAAVMSCVVEKTGGRFIDAADRGAIGSAISEVLKLASLDPAPVTIKPPAPVPLQRNGDVADAPIVLDGTRPGLHLATRLTDEGPLLNAPISWQILEAGQRSAGQSDVRLAVASGRGPTLSRRLANGRYIVEARLGLVTVRKQVEIKAAEPQTAVLSFNAGLLKVEVRLGDKGAPSADAVITVRKSGSGQRRETGGEPVWIGRSGTAVLAVPAGQYLVTAKEDLAQIERSVQVEAGNRETLRLALKAGRLQALLADTRKGASRDVQFLVEEDDPSARSGRRELLRRSGPSLDLVLPAGSYLVTASRGSAETVERFAVEAGAVTNRGMKLGAVNVRLLSRIGAKLPDGVPLTFTVERLSGIRRVITRRGEKEPVIELVPGRYRFEARVGAQNAVARHEAEVDGKNDLKVTLNTGAGAVHLRLVGAAGGLVLGEVFWQIFDSRGQAVWRTGQPEPVLALLGGQYTARAEFRGRLIEQVFNVRPGQSDIVELGG